MDLRSEPGNCFVEIRTESIFVLEIIKEWNTKREKPHEPQQMWEKKKVFWRACKRSRSKGGAIEVSNTMVAEERHCFRFKQHKRLLQVGSVLEQVRTEYSDCAEDYPVPLEKILAVVAKRGSCSEVVGRTPGNVCSWHIQRGWWGREERKRHGIYRGNVLWWKSVLKWEYFKRKEIEWYLCYESKEAEGHERSRQRESKRTRAAIRKGRR